MSVEVGAMDANILGGAPLGDIVGAAVDLANLTFTGDDITINGQTLATADLTAANTVNALLDVINEAVPNVTAPAVTEVVGDTNRPTGRGLSGRGYIAFTRG